MISGRCGKFRSRQQFDGAVHASFHSASPLAGSVRTLHAIPSALGEKRQYYSNKISVSQLMFLFKYQSTLTCRVHAQGASDAFNTSTVTHS